MIFDGISSVVCRLHHSTGTPCLVPFHGTDVFLQNINVQSKTCVCIFVILINSHSCTSEKDICGWFYAINQWETSCSRPAITTEHEGGQQLLSLTQSGQYRYGSGEAWMCFPAKPWRAFWAGEVCAFAKSDQLVSFAQVTSEPQTQHNHTCVLFKSVCSVKQGVSVKSR